MANFIPDTYGQATFGFRTGSSSKNSAFTLGYRLPAGPSDPLTNALAIRAAWSDASTKLWWPAAYSSQTTFLGVRVVEHRGAGLISADAAESVPGTGVQDQMPPNCAFLVHKVTTIGGRHNQGRLFLPPAWITEASISSSGTLLGADQITLNGRLEASRAAMETAGFNIVLLHGVSGLTPVTVTSLQVDGKIATQRRRLR